MPDELVVWVELFPLFGPAVTENTTGTPTSATKDPEVLGKLTPRRSAESGEVKVIESVTECPVGFLVVDPGKLVTGSIGAAQTIVAVLEVTLVAETGSVRVADIVSAPAFVADRLKVATPLELVLALVPSPLSGPPVTEKTTVIPTSGAPDGFEARALIVAEVFVVV